MAAQLGLSTDKISLAINALDTAAQHRLMTEIYDHMISPHGTSMHGKPPFTNAELVAMAAVCRMEPTSTAPQMARWIAGNFPFYTHEALNLLELGKPIRELVPHITEAVRYPNTPVTVLSVENRGTIHLDQPLCTPDINACRSFFRKYLQPLQTGFRIFDLPKELRLRVFEYVLALPTIGSVCTSSELHYISLLHKVHEQEHGLRSPAGAGYQYADHFTTNCYPVSIHDIMSLLAVNKQCYEEARPLFYKLNTFRVSFEDTLPLLVKSIEPSRIHFISSLEIRYMHTSKVRIRDAIVAIGKLSTARHLRRIAISTSDRDWFGISRRGRLLYDEPRELPAMAELITLMAKASKVEFVHPGGCRRIRNTCR